jgi:hypothetical protein
MPIEIRELHIKAVVDTGGEMTGGNQNQSGVKPAGQGDANNTDQIIDLCIEKILEILKEKKER